MKESRKKVTDGKGFSRREFLKTGAGQGATLVGAGVFLNTESTVEAQGIDRFAMVAALGDTLIPSTPDPGYKTLEPYNITAEVLKGLTLVKDSDLVTFNLASRPFFDDKTFLQLNEQQREQFLDIIEEETRIQDTRLLRTLTKVYRLTRTRVFTVYYSNYPEHLVARDEDDLPILPDGDQHQITNPNSKKIVTGWDIANYDPQPSWEREQELRARAKKIPGHWIE